MNLSPAEQLAHSTVRIECRLQNGQVSTGTGFFFSLNRDKERHVPVIITNKHVVQGSVTGHFVMTKVQSDGSPAIGSTHRFGLEQFEASWRPHPDSDIDLCAMPLAPLFKMAEQEDHAFFFAPLDIELIPTKADIEKMVGLEAVTMVGYPNGIWDEVNNLPVFRRGVLATDYSKDWNGKKEFLIDAACFPGSSGSPVMLFDIGGFQDREGMKVGASRVKLLGVLYAGPQHTIEGDVQVVTVPTQQRAVSIAGVPNNLGICIKSQAIRDFEAVFR